MELLKDLYYSKEHTWVRIENKIATVGITAFAQKELGEIVYVDLPNVNHNFKQDEVFGSVEAIKTVSDLFMPLSGKIIETNEQLLKEPTIVNSNPFDNGWMVKIEIEDLRETENLLTAEQYAQLNN
ncbi:MULTISPECIES: glycine cleavage system protein GcvH [Chryseobacterium group]|jgi:glycine cleavage system H protein|uniref:Glycine cleavage system H protein n=1 Tax=Chryseobacterium aquaticum TaxID=452084 RepID=A0A0Q3SM54_9FLAO|nr:MULTISPECIES: glycine cleavage system protein GcvH [Chryseobacterium]KQK26402.1 glycine cleavage system protein H [Chryseobacterium aquaticum]KQM36481.1 glycine cleavage system protein H [Chryseobacterium sp. Leaf201]KQS94216.1 glycine cleavage system protein H [Chryseobacterium sp. Leaf394]WFB65488.1 glycine cleavage system protein GcvH [Chryseobacterium sp. WX]